MTTTPTPLDPEPLLTVGEVAALFRVTTKTVARWAKTGKLAAIHTPGGHRRFREAEVRALLVQHHRDGGSVTVRLVAVVAAALAVPALAMVAPTPAAVLVGILATVAASIAVAGIYGTSDLDRTRAGYAEDFATLRAEPIEAWPPVPESFDVHVERAIDIRNSDSARSAR